jgi:hypothetical protein
MALEMGVPFKEKYFNGLKAIESNYYCGRLNGRARYLSEDGTRIADQVWRNGSLEK